MELTDLIKRAKEVQEAYRIFNEKSGHAKWSVAEYAQGLTS